ncbi:MAG: diphthamide synthesis protein [Candidatus Pacearchaeota archaeon]
MQMISASKAVDIDEIGNIDLEEKKLIKLIREKKARLVLLQLPNGLKQRALELSNFIEKNTKAKCLIWLDSCFGACDVSVIPSSMAKKIDILISFGHSLWPFSKKIKAREIN